MCARILATHLLGTVVEPILESLALSWRDPLVLDSNGHLLFYHSTVSTFCPFILIFTRFFFLS